MRRIHVGGKDRTAELGAGVDALVARDADPGFSELVAKQSVVLSLRDSASQAEFLDRHLALVRVRNGLRTDNFEIPRAPGRLSGCLVWFKRVVWRLLRYQHDRMAFQQSGLNWQLTHALELMRALHSRELAELAERVERLEGARDARNGVEQTLPPSESGPQRKKD